MEDCPWVAYCDYAAWRCGRRAMEIYLELEQTREALGGLEGATRQPKSDSEQDHELQGITVDEIEDDAFAAILLTDAEIMFYAGQRDALESCARGPVLDEATGNIVCRSVLPDALGYTAADFAQDAHRFDTGI